ncbi:shikimate 5-dehydrogenase I alpha [Lachnospiraceae bacterium KM106-2]|nr:shikimate 5-dehydrogenase I alpha [Lachnospiraceae bacterium KM106-2]
MIIAIFGSYENDTKEGLLMRYGLIGEKLGHSYSKVIHEKLADYTYDLIPLAKDELDAFMKAKDFAALNVTIPYKCEIIPYLDELDNNAKRIGAVNTIVNDHGRLIGHNTDFSGFEYMVLHNKIEVKDKKVLVLGIGGASKAIHAVLEHLGAKEIIMVYRRDTDTAISYETCFQHHLDANVIVNTTPVGMYPNCDASPIDLSKFDHLSAVLDIIYNPIETSLTKQANSLGIKGITGLEMLVAQAKYAVEFFLDKKLDESCIDAIYQDIRKTL